VSPRNLVQISPRPFQNTYVVFATPSKNRQKRCSMSSITLLRIDRSRSYLIHSLDTTPDLKEVFRVRGSKVKVTAWYNGGKSLLYYY